MHQDEDRLLRVFVQINPNLLAIKLASVGADYRTDIYLQRIRSVDVFSQPMKDRPVIDRVDRSKIAHLSNFLHIAVMKSIKWGLVYRPGQPVGSAEELLPGSAAQRGHLSAISPSATCLQDRKSTRLNSSH